MKRTNHALSISEWWSEYSIYCIIFLCFLIITFIYFTRTRDDNEYAYSYINKDYTRSKSRGPFESKGERICKEVVQEIFKKPFRKIRPNFLRNEKTNSNLEIDIYNDDLRLGVEYNGRQHYEYTPYFHKNEQAFIDQKERDEMKYRKCKERGINIIVVPHTIKEARIKEFIRDKVKELGYNI